jgi:hypothetical protein
VQPHQLAGKTLNGFEQLTEAPPAFPDGVPRIEPRLGVC